MNTADLIFVGGRVITLDPESRVVSAIAVRDGVIVGVGDDDAIRAMASDRTRTIDLQGGTVIPGINDSHCHAVSWGLARPPLTIDLSFPNVRSIAEIAELVSAAVATAQPGQWIMGAGWDPGFLDECKGDSDRQPTRHDLDPISPDNPVFLQDFSYHTAWVNSRALKMAGIDITTQPPAGSMIILGDDGFPAGILNEGAQHDVMEMLPAATDETREIAIRTSLHSFAELGITSITEPGLGPGDATGGMGAGGLQVYEELANRGELTVRVSALLFPVPMSKGYHEFREVLDGMERNLSADPRFLRVIGVKMLSDGIPPNKTAWMHDEYIGGGHGGLTVPGETVEQQIQEMRAMISHAHQSGYQVGVHVTGDRGIDEVVDAFVNAVANDPRPDPRHYVIHGDFATPRSIAMCAENGFGINMNPTIKWTIADLEEEVVGPTRAAYEWPYRDALDAGVMVASGSDAPVTAPDWRQGVSTMMLRTSKASGRVSGSDQTITLEQALRTYTINGAWQDFAEGWKGSLEVGKVADLCVLREDLEATAPDQIPSVTVTMTVLDGKVIYERDRA